MCTRSGIWHVSRVSPESEQPEGQEGVGDAVRGMFAPSGMDKADRRLEIIAGVLLAIATIAIAWSGYQATRWSGEQADAYARANTARTESAKAASRAQTLGSIDIALFTEWVNATAAGDSRKAAFYRARFRDDFQKPFAEWLALRPLKTPSAPKSPFELESYALADNIAAARLTEEAGENTAIAREANQRGDNYVLAAVLFATVLFFAGISTQLESRQVRAFGLLAAVVILIGGTVWILAMPINFGL